MKIRIGKVYKNKTGKYITPLLRKYYDNMLITYLKSVGVLAVGIGDFLIEEDYKQHIFVLIDIKFNTKVVESMLQYVFDKKYYERHYPFDNIVTGRMHMIVFKLPEDVVDTFLEGRYSELYSQEDAYEMIMDTDTLSIITKDEEYKPKFLKNIKEEFRAEKGKAPTITLEEIDDGRELDTPPEKKNEFFNYREPV